MTSTPSTNSPCRSASGRKDVTPVPMSLPEPFRGEVWDVDFDEFGLHPAVVLSINLLNVRLGHVAVIPVTGTRGPDQTRPRWCSTSTPDSPDTTSPTLT